MPGKLVVILMTSRPITITAEQISMRTKGRTACLASLDPPSPGLESIIGVEFDNCTETDGGAMRRRSDCALWCPQSLERAPPPRADGESNEYCHCLSAPRKDHARRVQSSQLPTPCAVTDALNEP